MSLLWHPRVGAIAITFDEHPPYHRCLEAHSYYSFLNSKVIVGCLMAELLYCQTWLQSYRWRYDWYVLGNCFWERWAPFRTLTFWFSHIYVHIYLDRSVYGVLICISCNPPMLSPWELPPALCPLSQMLHTLLSFSLDVSLMPALRASFMYVYSLFSQSSQISLGQKQTWFAHKALHFPTEWSPKLGSTQEILTKWSTRRMPQS